MRNCPSRNAHFPRDGPYWATGPLKRWLSPGADTVAFGTEWLNSPSEETALSEGHPSKRLTHARKLFQVLFRNRWDFNQRADRWPSAIREWHFPRAFFSPLLASGNGFHGNSWLASNLLRELPEARHQLPRKTSAWEHLSRQYPGHSQPLGGRPALGALLPSIPEFSGTVHGRMGNRPRGATAGPIAIAVRALQKHAMKKRRTIAAASTLSRCWVQPVV